MNADERDAALRLADWLEQGTYLLSKERYTTAALLRVLAAEQSHSADTIVETFNRISDGITHHAEFSNAPVVMCSKQHYDALASEPIQEPVAWMSWNDEAGYGYWESRSDAELYSAGDYAPQPLYTHPQQDTALREAAQAVLTLWDEKRVFDVGAAVERLRAALGGHHE